MKKLLPIIGAAALAFSAGIGINHLGRKLYNKLESDIFQKSKTAVIEDYIPQSEKPAEYQKPKINNISLEELSSNHPDLASIVKPLLNRDHDNKNIYFTDLDNDNIQELVLDSCCSGSGGFGNVHVFKKKDGKYTRMEFVPEDGKFYQGKLEVKDLDNDKIYEIVSDYTASGQESLANAVKRRWQRVFRLDNFQYKDSGLRIKDDGSFTDANDPNPYNVQQEERYARNDLEQRLQYAQPYNNYPQNDFEAYQPIEHYLRLNLRVRSDVATDENIPYIRNARVNFIVRSNTKDERRLIDEPQFTDHNGIVRLHYNFLTTKNDDPTACIEIYAPNHEFYQGCYGISRLENERGRAYLDDRLQVIKGRGELGILGDFNDVSLEAELVNKDFGRRYPTDF